MTPEQYKEFTEKFGTDAAAEMKRLADAIEKKLNDAWDAKSKGLLTEADFKKAMDEVKNTELKKLNEELEKLEGVSKAQGELINTMKENAGKSQRKTLQDLFSGTEVEIEQEGAKKKVDFMKEIKRLREQGRGNIKLTGEMLKAAGVTSISGSILDQDTSIGSPYLPGIGGAELQLFDIVRNPNFIVNHVNMGRTNQFRLAWINEIEMLGTVDTNIAEGGLKPITQHTFKVEFSEAKKAAAYIELTEEFDTDVPGLATLVRRLLQLDVIRAFDDQIQTDVIAVAHPYEITELNGMIGEAAGWDAVLAMMAQVGFYNFTPDTVAMNYLTDVLLETSKDNNAAYLLPPFASRIQSQMVFANKVAFRKVLVGDLKQYNVDIYKDFSLRIGWIDDFFIRNKFIVLGEMRYHSYISSARTKAICYDDIYETMTTIDGGSVSGF